MAPSDLVKWRTKQGLTQQQLGEMLGVAKMTVYRWEKAMREIPPFLHLALRWLEHEGGEPMMTQGKRKKSEKEKEG